LESFENDNTKLLITFGYDAMGNRVMKKDSNLNSHKCYTLWYERDAQGNPLSIYKERHDSMWWQECDIYGSSRVGVYYPDSLIYPKGYQVKRDSIYTMELWEGKRQYELSNHLGNVLTTISDKHIMLTRSSLHYNGTDSSYSMVDGYQPEVVSISDYYPFGMLEPGRNFSLLSHDSSYHFGFNGMMKDDDIEGKGDLYTTHFREIDPRLGGRWWSIDPITKAWESPYVGYGDNPIVFNDPSGADKGHPKYHLNKVKTGNKAPHTVKKGESLSKIAGNLRIALSDLEKANPQIKDYNKIYPGQQINIPASNNQANTKQTPAISGQPGTPTWASPSPGGFNNDKTTPNTNNSNSSSSTGIGSILSAIWYSPIARFIVPDMISVGGTFQTSSGVYTKQTEGIILMTRGEAGLYLTSTTGTGGIDRLGTDVGVDLDGGYYLGDAHNLSTNDLKGYSGEGTLGIDFGEIGRASGDVEGSVGFNSKGKPTTFNYGIGLSVGYGISGEFKASGGVSYTESVTTIVKF
jgi:RHS repeat-associated protein